MSQQEAKARRVSRKVAPAILADPAGVDQATSAAPVSEIGAGSGIVLAEAAIASADAVVPATSQAIEQAAEQIETVTDQAGAVAAEVIEPVVAATDETIAAVNEAASQTKTAPAAAPFAQFMKGLSMATAYETNPTQMFAGMNDKAKDTMEKGVKFAENFSDFTKGNVEALVASGRIAAKGVEEIAQSSADYSRKSVEHATAAMKSFAAVKSPTELFQLQGDYARSAVDSMVAETSKFTESYLKLMGEIAQPLTSRYAIAAEKIKAVVA